MNRPKHSGPILAAGLCAAAALFLGYRWGRSAAPAAPEEHEEKGPIATVKVAPMVRGRLDGRSTAFGGIVAAPGSAQTVAVAYECRVVSMAVSEGQAVAAGAPLGTVTDSPDALLSLEQARIDAKASGAQLQQARDRHALQLTDNATLAQAQQAFDTAQARVKSLEARHMGGQRILRSSGPGVVVRIAAQAGAVVPAGGPLVELADTAHLEARLGAEPSEANRMRQGAAVTLTVVEGVDAGGVQARIRAVSPAINPVTRLRDVYVELPSRHPFLFGQYVRGSLPSASGAGLLVPYAAVLPEEGKNILYTIRKGHAVRHEVQVLTQAGDRLQVSGADLDPAEPVVIQGNYELADGMAVQVEEAAP